ncbi:hypothetical protein [Roseateles sp. BYS96W]|uniref:TetR/AcrR family transcriptional regulator n=1 Tax=Pelomonas nitida TaxID=3299027 RepID=A0ABW7GB28_9BURK
MTSPPSSSACTAHKAVAITPKIALLRSSIFETSVRGALAELESDPDHEISVSAVIARAEVNRTTLYTKKKHDRSIYVHQDLIDDIEKAITRRAEHLAKIVAADSGAGPLTDANTPVTDIAELANEAVRQRAAAEAAGRQAKNASRSQRETEGRALGFALALQSIWPIGQPSPEMLTRVVRELSDRLLHEAPDAHEAARLEAAMLAAAFGNTKSPKHTRNGATLRSI